MSDSESLFVERRVDGGVPVRSWTRGVDVGDKAWQQLENIARLPVVEGWVAAMPDVHLGRGATVGSVIPTLHAIIPAAVGVDIGCGMMAAMTTLKASDLPDDLAGLRSRIEKAVPHGRSDRGGKNDCGSWRKTPAVVEKSWKKLKVGFREIVVEQPRLNRGRSFEQLGTLGTGNHFIEVCIDEAQRVWIMLHSGSRGVGNRIGTHFTSLAKKDMKQQIGELPDADLAYLREGSEHFDQYVFAVEWAQNFARVNRELMMTAVVEALRSSKILPRFQAQEQVVNCHHNYVQREAHFGKELFVTRKGAVRAGAGELGIIPGSMGTRSYIVRGRGSAESFESCSHGAGRAMSRTEARRRFKIEDHVEATKGVECRKDSAVLDETPAAYKPIEAVMAAQSDLVEVLHELKQVICVKG